VLLELIIIDAGERNATPLPHFSRKTGLACPKAPPNLHRNAGVWNTPQLTTPRTAAKLKLVAPSSRDPGGREKVSTA
jgi:hypothetical protein